MQYLNSHKYSNHFLHFICKFFGFHLQSYNEMKPAFESEGFREYQYGLENDKFNKLIDCVISLNQKIADDESLGEGFCIGHSYFCDIEEIKENTLTDIVEFEIIPLLKEYWFDEPSKVKEWTDRLRSAVK